MQKSMLERIINAGGTWMLLWKIRMWRAVAVTGVGIKVECRRLGNLVAVFKSLTAELVG